MRRNACTVHRNDATKDREAFSLSLCSGYTAPSARQAQIDDAVCDLHAGGRQVVQASQAVA